MKRWVEACAALLAGFGLGLAYAWLISPARYLDTTPDTLRADFKDQFRVVIAASYASNRDLARARARLALLGDANAIDTLTAQAQRMLAAGEPFEIVQQLALLATDLQRGTASLISPTPAQPTAGWESPAPPTTSQASAEQTPGPTETAEPPTPIPDTPTPRPTRTPLPTPGEPFVLTKQEPVCNPNLTEGLMQISVIDARRRQVAGAEIILTWNGGEEHFFTGFKPEIAGGYADYIMQPGVSYTVRVAANGTPIQNLAAPTCTDSNGQAYLGGLKLVFQQP